MFGGIGLGKILAFEVNRHLCLLPELLAESSHGRNWAQIFQFCRVQLMGQGLGIGRDLAGQLLQFAYTAADFRQIGSVLMKLLQLDGQQCEPLANIVVKLSGDSVALLFLGFNQPAAHVCERRLRPFALRDIRTMPTIRSILPCSLKCARPVFSTQIITTVRT